MFIVLIRIHLISAPKSPTHRKLWSFGRANDTSRSWISLLWTRGSTTITCWAAQDKAWMVKFDRFIWVGSYFKMARKDRSSPNCGQWSSSWWENMWILAIVATDCHSMAPCIAPGDLKVKFSQIIHARLWVTMGGRWIVLPPKGQRTCSRRREPLKDKWINKWKISLGKIQQINKKRRTKKNFPNPEKN